VIHHVLREGLPALVQRRDARRFPEFGLLSRAGRFTDLVDAVIITHFHTDHLAALPYFTEVRAASLGIHWTMALKPSAVGSTPPSLRPRSRTTSKP
jgi:glyoxylase-like metal-dependent hydrolase (beta-lactamase superfamily II)